MAPTHVCQRNPLYLLCIFFGFAWQFQEVVVVSEMRVQNTRDLFGKASHSFEDQSSGENPGNIKTPVFFWPLQDEWLGKNTHPWNSKHPFLIGCFSWMIPNLYIKQVCFNKHPIKNGCLEYQAIQSNANGFPLLCFGTVRTVDCWGLCSRIHLLGQGHGNIHQLAAPTKPAFLVSSHILGR